MAAVRAPPISRSPCTVTATPGNTRPPERSRSGDRSGRDLRHRGGAGGRDDDGWRTQKSHEPVHGPSFGMSHSRERWKRSMRLRDARSLPIRKTDVAISRPGAYIQAVPSWRGGFRRRRPRRRPDTGSPAPSSSNHSQCQSKPTPNPTPKPLGVGVGGLCGELVGSWRLGVPWDLELGAWDLTH